MTINIFGIGLRNITPLRGSDHKDGKGRINLFYFFQEFTGTDNACSDVLFCERVTGIIEEVFVPRYEKISPYFFAERQIVIILESTSDPETSGAKPHPHPPTPS
jgi:hypothetical protein